MKDLEKKNDVLFLQEYEKENCQGGSICDGTYRYHVQMSKICSDVPENPVLTACGTSILNAEMKGDVVADTNLCHGISTKSNQDSFYNIGTAVEVHVENLEDLQKNSEEDFEINSDASIFESSLEVENCEDDEYPSDDDFSLHNNNILIKIIWNPR